MMSGLGMAVRKFAFCIDKSRDINTFFKLMWNTKRFKWLQKRQNTYATLNDLPQKYNFRLKGQRAQIFLRTFSGDIAIFYEIFWNRVYELPLKNNDQVKTIIDLGANVGLASLFFSHTYPEAFIYSVEPEESNFNLLLRNLERGITKQHIVPIRTAIDSEDGEASIQIKDLRYNCRIVAVDDMSPTVKTTTMKTLMNEFSIMSIDILKIDIEGMEKRLFEGETEWLDRVRYLLIEFHSSDIKAFCIDVLLAKNWTLFPIKSGDDNGDLFYAKNNQN